MNAREQPNGYNEAGPEWLEPWCDEHPDGDGQRCVACIGASHDAWMHRAKAAEREAERLRSALTARETELVTWLVDNGFPFDWCSTNPAPAWLRPLVAAEWARRDNETVESYLWAVDQEQVWASSDALRKEQQ